MSPTLTATTTLWNGIETNRIDEGAKIASVTIENRGTDRQSYTLSTNVPIKDDDPRDEQLICDPPCGQTHITFAETDSQSIIRSGNDILDALFALAHDDARRNIDPNGRYLAGKKWDSVWTRDIAYSVNLALANVDPHRSQKSLLFKTTERKSGGNPQTIQDTGTGGSYPVSSDRVVWAMAAAELLKFLEGPERDQFRNTVYPVIANTIEQDRNLIFDASDGLYMGEESFLDWREQTYPARTATDILSIGTSKALSTNVLHFNILEVAAQLAKEQNLVSASAQYQTWANELKTSINQRFYNSKTGLYRALIFENIPMDTYDLLGEALTIISNVADENRATSGVASYPHTNLGAPVVFPQRKDLKPYHNQALWPFVTAYWIKAAAKVKNASVVEHGVNFLIKSAAFNLSNMENFELITGNNSETAINSRRQLWSVAGFMAMVQEVLFGLEANQEGIRFLPLITNNLRNLFQTDQIWLKHFNYRGKQINVLVNLPPFVAEKAGAYSIAKILLNGNETGQNFIPYSSLGQRNTFEITLGGVIEGLDPIRLISDNSTHLHWAPREPQLMSVNPVNGTLRIEYNSNGESDVTFNIYRNGSLTVSTYPDTAWTDPESKDYQDYIYIYAVQSVNPAGNVSFPSQPMYYMTPQNPVILPAKDFKNVGGEYVFNHGMYHYQNWGDRNHSLEFPDYTPARSGEYLVSTFYSNGSGPFNTGITCAVKKLVIEDTHTGATVEAKIIEMPQTASWSNWKNSSALTVKLDADKTYRIRLFEDPNTINMSFFNHFSGYNGNGGGSWPYNYVNIAQFKLVFLHP